MTAPAKLAMRFRVPLDRFDLEVDCESDRQVVGIYGPSGSGKTTWLETIAGLRRAVSGSLSIGGETWLDTGSGIDLPPERRGVGYVPQDRRLFPHLDVRGNLRFGMGREASDSPAVPFEEVVEMLELDSLLDRPVDEISGGEGQRVALGRALLSAPRLLLLDEPLASLDVGLRSRILPFLSRIRDRFEIPMLVVSHQPFELQVLCDEVFSLRDGRVVVQGRPGEVFTHPDVLGAVAGGGFENTLAGTLEGGTAEAARVRLGAGAEPGSTPTLSCRRFDGEEGDPVVVTIPARDVLLADRPVEGISARNIFPAVVDEIREDPGGRLVFARFGEGPDDRIVAELTSEAVGELWIEPGREVHVLIKSHSIEVCPTERVAPRGEEH